MLSGPEAEAWFAKRQKTIQLLEPCACGHCVECPYRLYSAASTAAKLCFSCRQGLHAGSKLERPE